tara:strand:+ start:638 stop:1441 length:804 start_codon:yes stop_codon:yes gene_type:complete
MNVNIQPLSGHPYTIKARLASRSPHELLGISSANNKRKPNNDKNILLAHPPVLLIQDEGGEQLLNRDSVSLQLNFNKGKIKKGIHVPESLVVFLVDKGNLNGDLMMLIGFLFGPLQRIYHEKKDAAGNLNWQQAINIVRENISLRSCIEQELFNGEELTVRHYMQLLRGANLSESSIAHMPGVNKSNKDNRKVKNKSNTNIICKALDGGKDTTLLQRKNSSLPAKESKIIMVTKESNFNFNKSLEIINNAGELGENQRLLNAKREEK